ncbi:hypothetical protein J4481_01545 [Candidatus Pacearchaeota archaeon]|nr:hypothetical protein [Candidatus Pacearchaeota archaeon]
MKNKIKQFHDKHYKTLLLIPLLILLFSFVYLGFFYKTNNDFIYKDISLTGGTSVTLYEEINVQDLQNELSSKLEDLNTREIYDVVTQERKAIVIETKSDGDCNF